RRRLRSADRRRRAALERSDGDRARRRHLHRTPSERIQLDQAAGHHAGRRALRTARVRDGLALPCLPGRARARRQRPLRARFDPGGAPTAQQTLRRSRSHCPTSDLPERTPRTEITMRMQEMTRPKTRLAAMVLTSSLFAASLAIAADRDRGILVLTSTNDPGTNQVLVYQLEAGTAPALSLVQTLRTGGQGGASGNAGILQMRDEFGAVANYGSGSVSELVRDGDFIQVRGQVRLASGCLKPDSVALTDEQLFVA